MSSIHVLTSMLVRDPVQSTKGVVTSLNSDSHVRRRTLERALLILFVFSLPLVNPWIRGDGVGYYAYARAPLIEHSLDFTHDYQMSNESFRGARLEANGQPKTDYRTRTNHLDNHFTVGPALLWSPFLLLAVCCWRGHWALLSRQTASRRRTAMRWGLGPRFAAFWR